MLQCGGSHVIEFDLFEVSSNNPLILELQVNAREDPVTYSLELFFRIKDFADSQQLRGDLHEKTIMQHKSILFYHVKIQENGLPE